MTQAKHAAKRKRRRKAVPVLGIAGLSLSRIGEVFASTRMLRRDRLRRLDHVDSNGG